MNLTMLWTLFCAFFQVGLFSVGGGYAAIPLIQDQIVNKLGLMDLAGFSDLITIAEMTPGPISINSSTFVGMKLAGVPGVVICALGCILPSFCISLVLARLYYKYRSLNAVQTVLGAMRPAVVALIGSAGLAILMLALFNGTLKHFSFTDFRWIEFVIFAAALFLLRRFKGKISAVAVILGSGALGAGAYFLLGLA